MELVSEVMMTFYYLLIILITVVFSFKTKKRHYKNLPPTPPSLPIIGHLHLVKPPLHRALRNLSTKYGDVFSLGFGFRQVVVVSSPSVVEECFTKNDVVLANRPQLLAAKHIGYNSTNMVDTPYGDHWRNLRRIGATEIFSSGRLNLFVGIRRDEVKRLLFKLSHHKDWQKVELKSMLQELLYNILMRMVAGKRCDNNDMVNKEEARRYRDTLRVALGLAGAGNSAETFYRF
uniref:Cytochrome P450 n=1 Tax=Cannabis sativa TaxID=3483 RepID=A0A803NRY4_CANSA